MVQSAMTITILRVILFLGGQHRNIQKPRMPNPTSRTHMSSNQNWSCFAGTDFPASVRDNPCKSSGSNGIAQQESPLLTWQTKNQTDFWDKIGLQYFAIWCYDTVFPSPLQNSEKRGNFVHQLHRHIRDRRQYQSLSTSRLSMWIAIVWWKQKVWE
jgi:hypothetical protein